MPMSLNVRDSSHILFVTHTIFGPLRTSTTKSRNKRTGEPILASCRKIPSSRTGFEISLLTCRSTTLPMALLHGFQLTLWAICTLIAIWRSSCCTGPNSWPPSSSPPVGNGRSTSLCAIHRRRVCVACKRLSLKDSGYRACCTCSVGSTSPSIVF